MEIQLTIRTYGMSLVKKKNVDVGPYMKGIIEGGASLRDWRHTYWNAASVIETRYIMYDCAILIDCIINSWRRTHTRTQIGVRQRKYRTRHPPSILLSLFHILNRQKKNVYYYFFLAPYKGYSLCHFFSLLSADSRLQLGSLLFFYSLSLSFFLTQKLCRLKASPTDAPHNKSKFSFFFLFSHYFHHILIVFLFFFFNFKEPAGKKKWNSYRQDGAKTYCISGALARRDSFLTPSVFSSSVLLVFLFLPPSPQF